MKLPRIFTRSRDKPKNYQGDRVGGGWFFPFGRTTAGKSVTERSAMQLTTVYACVRIIAETIASLPLHTYQYTPNGKEKIPEHPLYFILHDEPNPEMTSFVFRETTASHLLLWGNAYAQIIRNGKGEVTALYPMLPNRMQVDRGKDSRIYYTYNSDTQGQVVLTAQEVLHIPGLGFDGLLGYSPIAMAKNAIGMSMAADEYGARFFSNSGTPSGILEYPGALKDPKKVRTPGGKHTAEAAMRIRWLCSKRGCTSNRSQSRRIPHSFWRPGSFRSTKSAVSSGCRRTWWRTWTNPALTT